MGRSGDESPTEIHRQWEKFESIKSSGMAGFPPDGGVVEDAMDPWSQKRGKMPWKTSHGGD